jgi:hypothetical protein
LNDQILGPKAEFARRPAGQRDPPEPLPRGRAVHLRRLVQLVGHE